MEIKTDGKQSLKVKLHVPLWYILKIKYAFTVFTFAFKALHFSCCSQVAQLRTVLLLCRRVSEQWRLFTAEFEGARVGRLFNLLRLILKPNDEILFLFRL